MRKRKASAPERAIDEIRGNSGFALAGSREEVHCPSREDAPLPLPKGAVFVGLMLRLA